MKNIITVGIITVLTSIGLSGCNWSAPEQDQKQQTITPAETLKTTQTYSDSANKVTFEYPKNWIAAENKANTVLALDSNVLLEREKQGTVLYGIIPNAEKATLQAYLDKTYEDCLAEPEDPALADFGPMCGPKLDLSTWKALKVDGYEAYQSDWKGIPASGEMGKYTYIAADNIFIYFIAVRTGETELNFIDKVLQDILDTLSIK